MRTLTFLFIFSFIYTAQSQLLQPEYDYGSEETRKEAILIDDGLLKKAELDLLETIRNFPFNAANDKAYLLLNEIDMKTGNWSVAESRLTAFIKERKNSPFVPIAAYKRALIAYQQGRWKDAEYYFIDAYNFSSADEIIRGGKYYEELSHNSKYMEGVSVMQQGRFDDCLIIYDFLVERYPDFQYTDDALFYQGRIYESQKEYETALEKYSQIPKTKPFDDHYVISRIREANVNLLIRKPSAAIYNLENAETTLNHIDMQDSIGAKYEYPAFKTGSREKILYLRGEANNLAGNYSKALVIFQSFLETYIDSEYRVLSMLGAGWAQLNLGDEEDAIRYYDLVIKNTDEGNNKERAIAQLYRAVALKRLGKREKAQKQFAALSMKAAYPYLAQVLLELGQMQYEDGSYEEARRTLERASRETTDEITEVRINLLLGASYMEIGFWEPAAKEFENAERISLQAEERFMPDKETYIAEARLKQGISYVKSNKNMNAVKPILAFLGMKKGSKRADEAIFWLAEAYYQADMLKNSAENYKKIVEDYPLSKRREEALYGLGWSYFRNKDFSTSTKYFDQMIKEFPDTKYSLEVLTRQGDGYYLQKNFSQAAYFYERAKRQAPGTEEGQYSAYQLCHALYRKGDFEGAITSLLEFVSYYPNSPYAPNSLYLIGWIRFRQARYSESIDNFNFLIQAYPKSGLVARAHYAIGDAYYNMQEFELAINSYKTVIEQYPTSSISTEALKSVQQSLLILGREEEAMQIIDNYVEGNEDSPFVEDFRFKKGEMFYQGRKYNDAVSEYDKFLKEHPDSDKNDEVMYWMGKSYANLNEVGKALDTYEALINKFPKSEYAPMSLLESAILYKEMANIDEADAMFEKLADKYPDHQSAAQAGYERASLKYLVGDTVSAMKIYRVVANKYSTMDYGDQSRYRLAMYYRGRGDNDSARANFEILSNVEENPTIASEAQYRIGELWMRDENYEKAIEEYKVSRDDFSGYDDWYSLALLGLGEAYEKLEMWEEAKESYRTLIEWRPEDDYGNTAKSRLERIKNK
jgi:TolA-binding protein